MQVAHNNVILKKAIIPVINARSHATEMQILLTNDDGIESPGLWAAAQALSELGFVHVVAPANNRQAPGAACL